MKQVNWIICCPDCGLRLRLRDESYLGRRGRCPQCGRKFVLELPRADSFAPRNRRRRMQRETERIAETVDVNMSHLIDDGPADVG